MEPPKLGLFSIYESLHAELHLLISFNNLIYKTGIDLCGGKYQDLLTRKTNFDQFKANFNIYCAGT